MAVGHLVPVMLPGHEAGALLTIPRRGARSRDSRWQILLRSATGNHGREQASARRELVAHDPGRVSESIDAVRVVAFGLDFVVLSLEACEPRRSFRDQHHVPLP